MNAAAIERLEHGLEGLLAMLESEDESAVRSIEATFREVTAAFEAVRPVLADGGGGAGDERLVRCLRLYAVALNTLTQQRAQLVHTERTCQQAAERLGSLRQGHTSGVNCNVRA